jgi:hypothetical protein
MWLAILAATVDCGGLLTDEPGGDAGVNVPTEDAATVVEAQADVACALPPPMNGPGPCTFCGNLWYCPHSEMPEPQCPAAAYDENWCSFDCIMCGAPASYGTIGPFSKTAWSFSCGTGPEHGNVIVSVGDECAAP